MRQTRWFWAAVVTVTVIAALGAGLGFGGGPGTRDGWEAASWAAGLTAALSLAVTAIVWAAADAPARDRHRNRGGGERPDGGGERPDRGGGERSNGDGAERPTRVGASTGPSTAAPDTAHLRRLVRAHRDNVRILEHQLALFGPLHAPPHKRTELDIVKQELAHLEELLRRADDAQR